MPAFQSLSDSDALTLARAGAGHPDGHVREPSVAWLGEFGAEPVDLELLLPRLADFVPQVAAKARPAFREVSRRLEPTAVLPRLESVGRLRVRVRWSTAADALVLRWVLGARAELLEAAPGLSPWAFRACLAALALDGMAADERALLALDSRDVATARRALDELARESPEDDVWAGVLRVALKSRHASVRARAVVRWAQLELPGTDDVLRAACVDAGRSVRWVGQFRLGRRGRNPAEVVRSALARRVTVGGILALGECGGAADVDRLAPLLDARPKVAVAALRAMAGLTPEIAARAALELLGDPRPGVVREAARLLADGVGPVRPARLISLVVDPPYTHTAARVMPLIARLPKFDALGALLAVAARTTGEGGVDPRPLLERWLAQHNDRSYAVTASPARRDTLLAEVEAAGLPAPLADGLRFALA